MPSGVRRRKLARSKVTKATRRLKDRHRKVPISTNPIIEANWDPKLTLAQNYKKLGLTAKLAKPAGGVEKEIKVRDGDEDEDDEEEKQKQNRPRKLGRDEGRIIRHEDGSVTVEYGGDDDSEDDEEWLGLDEDKTEVVKQLEELSKRAVVTERSQSERETEWIEALVAKHGDDYEAMFWDKKLNIYQQSVGDLKRRIKKWNDSKKKKAQQ